ncbi:LEUCINE-RICH REPEAT EXTENSIN-LIKE PROTEIN 2 [Salix purpurea]|uniref:LEUCINE-RICH REPEAT EXTENSIN-LIKE PROTEIN 2 n=1 Tax=Salix purpurea TaxID=77065 RepID=A0A9Q0USN4_SALPP|nr:LEUCINE-RICH REPEAT EXTENSIN-LIKE PROTEIN 2 [Salix purpurea]
MRRAASSSSSSSSSATPHPPPPPPKTPYCTPLAPPPPRFYYVTSVPGNLYETDPYYQWGLYDGARQNTATWLLLLVGLGVIELLVICGLNTNAGRTLREQCRPIPSIRKIK